MKEDTEMSDVHVTPLMRKVMNVQDRCNEFAIENSALRSEVEYLRKQIAEIQARRVEGIKQQLANCVTDEKTIVFSPDAATAILTALGGFSPEPR